MSNPYESPQVPGSSPFQPQVDREKLRQVARYQRWALFALLANILLNVAAFAIPRDSPAPAIAVGLLGVIVVLVTIVAVFLLAKELTNAGLAVLCAVLMCVPCISLLTLLVLNQKATTLLQQNGIKVGFMGVDPNRV